MVVLLAYDAAENGSRAFCLYSKASIDGFAGTLQEDQRDVSVTSIVYSGRVILDSEYPSHLGLEAGAILREIKRRRGYLLVTKFRNFSNR